VRVSWDDCSVLAANKDWAGPGNYVVVLSATNLSGSYRRFDGTFKFAPQRVVPAWDFSTFDYWGTAPCQGPSRLSATNLGGSCPSFPASAVSAMMWEGSLTSPAPTFLDVHGSLDDTFAPDPQTRYTLLRLVFDHSRSVVGPSTAGKCGEVEQPMCINLVAINIRDGLNNVVPYAFEQSFATWQDPANTTGCPGATPAAARTWGAIKASYR